jgi:hypothetical protein
VFFATDYADYTDFVSRRGILDKACALNVVCAQDLYLVCRATMSPIAKGEAPADGKITLILLLI